MTENKAIDILKDNFFKAIIESGQNENYAKDMWLCWWKLASNAIKKGIVSGMEEYAQQQLAPSLDEGEIFDNLIKRHIEKMWGGLEMASVQHFQETGKVNGSFRLRLIAMLKFYEFHLERAAQTDVATDDDWISVEDRLPEVVYTDDDGWETCGFVLGARRSDGEIKGIVYSAGVEYLPKENKWRLYGDYLLARIDVTHWRPLPKPPKQ